MLLFLINLKSNMITGLDCLLRSYTNGDILTLGVTWGLSHVP